MSITADNYFSIVPEWVLDSSISANAVRVYAVLQRYADRDGRCHPSRRTIADRCHVSTNTIDRAVAELVELGAVTVKQRRIGNEPTSNLYLVRTARPTSVITGGAGIPTGGDTPFTGGERGLPTSDEQTKASVNESHEPESLFPDAAHREVVEVIDVRERQTITARDVAAHWVDTYRAVHGSDPAAQSVKRVAQAAKQLLDEQRAVDDVLAAAADAATGGHANLASALTYLLARNKTHGRRSEPRGFSGIREFLQGGEL